MSSYFFLNGKPFIPPPPPFLIAQGGGGQGLGESGANQKDKSHLEKVHGQL